MLCSDASRVHLFKTARDCAKAVVCWRCVLRVRGVEIARRLCAAGVLKVRIESEESRDCTKAVCCWCVEGAYWVRGDNTATVADDDAVVTYCWWSLQIRLWRRSHARLGVQQPGQLIITHFSARLLTLQYCCYCSTYCNTFRPHHITTQLFIISECLCWNWCRSANKRYFCAKI